MAEMVMATLVAAFLGAVVGVFVTWYGLKPIVTGGHVDTIAVSESKEQEDAKSQEAIGFMSQSVSDGRSVSFAQNRLVRVWWLGGGAGKTAKEEE